LCSVIFFQKKAPFMRQFKKCRTDSPHENMALAHCMLDT
jgi:hypothetical protein